MSLAFGGHIIAGLALNGSAVSACYNGQIVWPEEQRATVFLDPGRTSNYDYLKMRFVTPNGDEIILEDGLTSTASASAMVPVNSTAYWTANGDQTNASARYHVTALGASGFSGMSAYTAVTTGFYEDPNVESYGSAVLTSTGSASAKANTTWASKITYGEGSTNYYSTVSASSWAGEVTGAWGYAGGRYLWIPNGASVGFSGSSNSGKTYNVKSEMTALSGYSITYSHRGQGTRSLVTGYLTSKMTGFRLEGGRNKCVYATGTALYLATASGISAAAWQPKTIITAFSSNLNSGSSIAEYIVGSAGAGLVYGFASSKSYGTMKNSAGTWIGISANNDVYAWGDHHDWVSNSAKMSGHFSAFRRKGGTGNNNATWVLYNRNSSNQSISGKAGQFALPTASSTTPKTTTQTGEFSLTGRSANAALCFSISVAQNANLCCNCSGAWTASGVVL